MKCVSFLIVIAVLVLPVHSPIPALIAQELVPRFEPTDCPVSVSSRSVECGYLAVPEDYFDPANTNTMRLMVAILSAGANPLPDPLVYLTGGPGISPFLFLDALLSGFAPFLTRRDVIVLGLRGTTFSEPALNCPEFTDLFHDALPVGWNGRDHATQRTDVLLTCLTRLASEGHDLSAFNSSQAAADVDALRIALGYDEYNVYSQSYGTMLSQYVLRDHGAEGHIRSVIMESAIPADIRVGLFLKGIIDDLDAVITACADDPACNAAYPDLQDVFYEVVNTLDAEPATVRVPNWAQGGSVNIQANGTDLIEAAGISLWMLHGASTLPHDIYAVRDGDMTLIANAKAMYAFGLLPVFSWGSHVAVWCGDGTLAITPEEQAAIQSELPEIYHSFAVSYGQPAGPVTAEFCQEAGIPVSEHRVSEPVFSDVPTMVILGEYDPWSWLMPDESAYIARNLTNARLLIVPGTGHNPSGAPHNGQCVGESMLEFLDDPALPLDMSCFEEPGNEFRFVVP